MSPERRMSEAPLLSEKLTKIFNLLPAGDILPDERIKILKKDKTIVAINMGICKQPDNNATYTFNILGKGLSHNVVTFTIDEQRGLRDIAVSLDQVKFNVCGATIAKSYTRVFQHPMDPDRKIALDKMPERKRLVVANGLIDWINRMLERDGYISLPMTAHVK